MSLANPSAILWAMLAIPVIIFYILKIRLRRVPVSTVLFWQQIFEEKKPRSLWERLRHLVSLAVQLALLFLLVGALTEPFFSSDINQAKRIVLVIDNSASMNAIEEGKSRLEKAKDEGFRLIAGMSYRDELAIVVAGTQPRVVCGLTSHQRTLREALGAVTNTDGPTKVKEGIELANRLIAEQQADGKNTNVVVVSDGCAEGIEKLLEQPDIQLVRIGQKTGNVGISRLQVRRSPVEPTGFEIQIEVVNQSEEEAECRLELKLNDDVIDVYPLKLKPNDKWGQVIEKVSVDGGRILARLTDKESTKTDFVDPLETDNKAVALLPKREIQPVYLTRPEANLFLEKVFQASSLVQLFTGKVPPENVPANAVQVFYRTVPNPLPKGPLLLIDPKEDCELWKVGEKIANPIITQQDKESPLMTYLRLDNVLMPDAKKLTFSASAGKPHILAAAVTGEPMYVLIDRPEGKVLVLSVNIDVSELPFRTAFPIMITNALAFFANNKGELREAQATGSTTEINLPSTGESGGDVLLKAPDGTTRKLPNGVSKTTIGPFDQVGIWTVLGDKPNAAPLDEIAVNLNNKTESDIRSPDTLASQETIERTGLISGFLGRPVWFYLIALAWFLCALEWYLYQRRFLS